MINKVQSDGFEVYSIHNDKLHLFLCPSLGNNLFRIWDRIKKRDVLRVPASLKILQSMRYIMVSRCYFHLTVPASAGFRYGESLSTGYQLGK